jgi:hypothetical protein
MLTEQAIAVVVFLILLAIAIFGLFSASRESERLDRSRRSGTDRQGDNSGVILRP